MRCSISSAVHDAILTAAALDPSREICGLVFGRDEGVVMWEPCANVADDPASRFEIDPKALIAALRAERSGGPRLIGYVHSHPNGSAEPSATDAAMADPDGKLWLIACRSTLTAWRATPHGALHGRFDPVALDISPVAAMGALRQKAPVARSSS